MRGEKITKVHGEMQYTRTLDEHKGTRFLILVEDPISNEMSITNSIGSIFRSQQRSRFPIDAIIYLDSNGDWDAYTEEHGFILLRLPKKMNVKQVMNAYILKSRLIPKEEINESN